MENLPMNKRSRNCIRALTVTSLLAATLAPIVISSSSFAQVTTPKQPTITKREVQAKKDSIIKSCGINTAQQMPVNFPIPSYPNNVTKTNFINSTKGSKSAAATILTKDPPNTVFQWYQAACLKANFQVKSHQPKQLKKNAKFDRHYLINAKKDKQELYIFCIQNPKAPGSIINVSWTMQPK